MWIPPTVSKIENTNLKNLQSLKFQELLATPEFSAQWLQTMRNDELNLGLTVIEFGNLVKMEGQRHSPPIYDLWPPSL